MKKLFTLLVLIAFTILMACNKESTKDDMVLSLQEIAPLPDNQVVTTTDNEDAGKAIFTINNKDKSVYEKEALLLTNTSVKAVSYHWDFGNGDTSTKAHPDYTYDIHGYYTVTLTIIDENDRAHRATDNILVYCRFDGGVHDQ